MLPMNNHTKWNYSKGLVGFQYIKTSRGFVASFQEFDIAIDRKVAYNNKVKVDWKRCGK